jgi:exosome complex RNA-binding protein Rrp42 (RNase PH superfamily)
MRYDNGKDWVEIKGVADRTMRELTALDGPSLAEAHAFAVSVTADAHFTDRDGNVVDWRTDVLGLSMQQWNFWKAKIWVAALDEKLDPE